MLNDILVLDTGKDEPPSRHVVRLRTSCWRSGSGMHMTKSITTLKKLSVGYLALEEECDNVGVEDMFYTLINLHECKDGIYEVVICNVGRDWESGHIDDYDFKLVPFEPER